jgi:molybdenum cofactor sulfurtransferase
VGEAYPFTEGSAFVLGEDSHNSVHGIREFAQRAGSKVSYIPSTPQGGFRLDTAKVKRSRVAPLSKSDLSRQTGGSIIEPAEFETGQPLPVRRHWSI